jgi:hypothetical protein
MHAKKMSSEQGKNGRRLKKLCAARECRRPGASTCDWCFAHRSSSKSTISLICTRNQQPIFVSLKINPMVKSAHRAQRSFLAGVYRCGITMAAGSPPVSIENVEEPKGEAGNGIAFRRR